MDTSGAVYGAWNDQNDPGEINRKRHAEQYYESVRNRNRRIEVEKVARHSGFSKNDIETIYKHIFVDYHELNDGLKRFDADYDMSQSWDRLIQGKKIEEHDIILLHHELRESQLMRKGYNYEEAHALTQREFNYVEALIRWKIERGDL